MTLTRFFFIFSQLFFLTTCESCKNKSVSDLCQTVYTTYIVFTNDICHIMKHLTHNTHILYFLFHNVSFPLLSYTIFYLCPYWDWSPFSGYLFVILLRCRLCCFVLAKLVHFPISDKENLLFQATFSSIIDWRQCYWHVSNDLIDLRQCFRLMYINLPNHHDYEKEFLPINKVIELAKVRQISPCLLTLVS